MSSSKFKAIPVVDGNGDQLTLYEFRERGPLFGLVSKKRYSLGTGEAVEERAGVYIVAATGEILTPVGAS